MSPPHSNLCMDKGTTWVNRSLRHVRFDQIKKGSLSFTAQRTFLILRLDFTALKSSPNQSPPQLDTLGKISQVTDLFLCDLKHMDSDIHKRFTGVPNKLIIDNIKWLASSGKKIIIRFPVIPGFNDSQDNIEQTLQFASNLDSIAGIDLLPYNSGGQEKASRLTQKYEIMKIQPPSPEQMVDIAGRIEGFGFEVKIGG